MAEAPQVMIAEDNEDDLLFSRRIIQRAGITSPILAAADGEEAIKMLEGFWASGQHSLVLLFLDIKMPKLNGFEVLA